jgi:hypothetical protein
MVQIGLKIADLTYMDFTKFRFLWRLGVSRLCDGFRMFNALKKVRRIFVVKRRKVVGEPPTEETLTTAYRDGLAKK